MLARQVTTRSLLIVDIGPGGCAGKAGELITRVKDSRNLNLFIY